MRDPPWAGAERARISLIRDVVLLHPRARQHSTPTSSHFCRDVPSLSRVGDEHVARQSRSFENIRDAEFFQRCENSMLNKSNVRMILWWANRLDELRAPNCFANGDFLNASLWVTRLTTSALLI